MCAQVVEQLAALGVSAEATDKVLAAMAVSSIDQLEQLVGAETAAVVEMQRLFQLAEGYGYASWLQFDASIVRGLAYYTGA